MRPIGGSDSEKPSASASAANHSTWRLHGCAAAQAGGAPVRETETTLQPAPASVWQTRLPTKPLPPKTAIRGGVEAAVAAQSAAIMVRSAVCGEQLRAPRVAIDEDTANQSGGGTWGEPRD